MRMFVIAFSLVTLLVFLTLPKVFASPTAIDINTFSGNETVITFDSIAHVEEITTQFAELGATFSGGLFGNDSFLIKRLFTNPGNGVACNFPGIPRPVSDNITIDFTPPVVRIGFNAITNDLDDTTITVYKFSGGSQVPTGSITFDTSDTEDRFIGVEDTEGIDRLVFDAANNALGAICINDFRFEVIVVDIDIMPGSDANCFNNNGHGVISTAILSSEVFDATEVNPETVRLEGMAIKMVGKSGRLLTQIRDANHDGLDDLVVKIEDEDGVFGSGTTEARLTANTFDGVPILGTDSICIVP